MSQNILKKDRIRFEKELNKYLDKVCILKDRQTALDCIEPQRYIQTKYGIDYRVDNPDADGTLFTLTGRFEGEKEDYAKLKDDGIDCNPFTGKWNFHLLKDDGVDGSINHIVKWLEIIRKR